MNFAGLLPASLTEWVRVILVAFLVAAVSYPLGQCDGRRTERARWDAALQKANADFLREKARADELAANQRLTDTIAVNELEKGLRDAIADTPDGAPDAVRIRLGCERLRRAGQNTSHIPACRGPSG